MVRARVPGDHSPVRSSTGNCKGASRPVPAGSPLLSSAHLWQNLQDAQGLPGCVRRVSSLVMCLQLLRLGGKAADDAPLPAMGCWNSAGDTGSIGDSDSTWTTELSLSLGWELGV